jgi:hypothetical protein
MSTHPLLVLATACVVVACATQTAAEKQVVNIPLNASLYNAGEIAQVTLAAHGDETDMSFFVSGVPLYTSLPVRLYTYIYPGSCQALGEKPAYALNQTVTTNRMHSGGRSVWTFSKAAPVSLAELRSKSYAVVLKTSPVDGSQGIFCGNIA